MSGLIANLLFLARHEGKLNPQDVSKTDILELLNSLAKQYTHLAAEKNLKFIPEIPKISPEVFSEQSKPSIYVDRDLLITAIRNLLDNAIKYTPSGGIVTLKLAIKTPSYSHSSSRYWCWYSCYGLTPYFRSLLPSR